MNLQFQKQLVSIKYKVTNPSIKPLKISKLIKKILKF